MDKNIKNIKVVQMPLPEGANIIVGKTHFIKSVEDLYEALIQSVPGIKFGIAFNEASGDRLIRYEGNDDELIKTAIEAAKLSSCGHTFYIYIKNAWPINVIDRIKSTPEVVELIACTANPLQLIIVETEQGNGIIGVVDGYRPLAIENEEKKQERHRFLRKIGYKK
jgi:adenosine/AMP kinase